MAIGCGGAVSVVGPGGATGSTTNTAGAGSSTSSGVDPDPQMATSTTGTAGSGSSSGEEDNLCGNDVLDAGEACDDSNGADADGCNNDCVPSGAVLWQWPSEVGDIESIAVGADDSVHLGIVDPAQTSGRIVRLTDQGVAAEVQTITPTVTVLEDEFVRLFIPGVAVVGDAVIYVSDAIVRDQVQEVRSEGTIERLGVGGWSFAEPERNFSKIAVTSTGELVGRDGDSRFKYAANGDEIWRFPSEDGGTRVTRLGAGGVLFMSGRMLVGVDADGAERWRIDPGSTLELNFLRGAARSDGTVLVVQRIVTDFLASQWFGKYWHIDADGSVLSTTDLAYAATAIAVGPDGNIVMAHHAEEGRVTRIVKYSPQFEPLWETPLGSEGPVGVSELVIDSQGAIIALLSTNAVTKLAP